MEKVMINGFYAVRMAVVSNGVTAGKTIGFYKMEDRDDYIRNATNAICAYHWEQLTNAIKAMPSFSMPIN